MLEENFIFDIDTIKDELKEGLENLKKIELRYVHYQNQMAVSPDNKTLQQYFAQITSTRMSQKSYVDFLKEKLKEYESRAFKTGESTDGEV
jgi:hypothetical protein